MPLDTPSRPVSKPVGYLAARKGGEWSAEIAKHLYFHDAETPVQELIERCRKEPVHFTTEDKERFCGPGKLFTLWDQPEGYVILDADIHAFRRDLDLPEKDLVLVIPSSIEGVPVIRVAAEAFRPWLSYNTILRLLVLPEGMTEIAPGALAPLAFENLALPSTLVDFGEHALDLSKLTTVTSPQETRFYVAEGNPRYEARDGFLLTNEGRELVMAEYPYPETLQLPKGLEHINRNAFVKGGGIPHAVVCPETLETTKDTLDEQVLWVRQNNTAFARFLEKERLFGVSPRYIERDGMTYDLAEDGTAFLAKSPAVASHVSIPAQVDGHTVTRIAERALPRHLKMLDAPASIRTIGGNNPCDDLAKLILVNGLEEIGPRSFTATRLSDPVFLPASVKHVGMGSFAGCWLMLEEYGCTVRIPSFSRHALFTERGSKPFFNMDAYDALLCGKRMVTDRMQCILHRLDSDAPISADNLDTMISWIRQDTDAVMEQVALRGSVRLVKMLAEAGFYTEEASETQCDLLRTAHRNDSLAWLMKWRSTAFAPQKKRPSARFAL